MQRQISLPEANKNLKIEHSGADFSFHAAGVMEKSVSETYSTKLYNKVEGELNRYTQSFFKIVQQPQRLRRNREAVKRIKSGKRFYSFSQEIW